MAARLHMHARLSPFQALKKLSDAQKAVISHQAEKQCKEEAVTLLEAKIAEMELEKTRSDEKLQGASSDISTFKEELSRRESEIADLKKVIFAANLTH